AAGDGVAAEGAGRHTRGAGAVGQRGAVDGDAVAAVAGGVRAVDRHLGGPAPRTDPVAAVAVRGDLLQVRLGDEAVQDHALQQVAGEVRIADVQLRGVRGEQSDRAVVGGDALER